MKAQGLRLSVHLSEGIAKRLFRNEQPTPTLGFMVEPSPVVRGMAYHATCDGAFELSLTHGKNFGEFIRQDQKQNAFVLFTSMSCSAVGHAHHFAPQR